jgi:hypothetical protein
LEPAADSRLRAHASRCPDCAGWLKGSAALTTAVTKMSRPEPAADFSIRVVQSYSAEKRQVQKDLRRRWVWGGSALAAAAAVLLAVFGAREAPPNGQHLVPAPRVEPLLGFNYQQLLLSAGNITRRQSAWVAELAQGLKPVTSSVHSAFSTLRRTLPANQLAHVL